MEQIFFNKKQRKIFLSITYILLLSAISFIFLKWQGVAQAQLMLIPTRVVFESRTRSEELHLINKGNKENTYRISFQHLRMKEDGSYEEIKEPKPGEQFVDELVRYSPRQVTIKPGESQIVRLMVRKPKNLSPGEYRSNMLFKEIAPPNFGANVEKESKKVEGININLTPLFAVSIPVIVRHGDVSAQIEIEEARVISEEIPSPNIKAEGKEISSKLLLKLRRSGDVSVYGDIVATFIPENSLQQYEVARISGVSVFSPNECRNISLSLKTPPGVSLERGQLHIVYQEQESEDILAEKTLILPL